MKKIIILLVLCFPIVVNAMNASQKRKLRKERERQYHSEIFKTPIKRDEKGVREDIKANLRRIDSRRDLTNLLLRASINLPDDRKVNLERFANWLDQQTYVLKQRQRNKEEKAKETESRNLENEVRKNLNFLELKSDKRKLLPKGDARFNSGDITLSRAPHFAYQSDN